jgi:uncharacterized protein (DUF58 family)
MLAPSSTPRAKSLEQLLGPQLMARLDRLDMLSRKIFSGKLPGERRSKKRGASVEFDDYREYVPGDDLRHIDWNVFARLDKFFLKIFREEEDLALHIVLDASASMDAGVPSKLVFAQRVAMALGYVGIVNQNRVSASIVGAPGRRGVETIAPMRGRRNVQRLAQFLIENVSAPVGYSGERRPRVGFNRAMLEISRSRRGRGVMVLLSDFLVPEDWKRGLNYLVAGGRGYDLYVVQVMSAGELEPEKEAGGGVVGDLRLTDVETGAAAEVTVSGALLKRYKERVKRFVEEVHGACAARGVSHVLSRSDSDVDQLLLGYFRGRGLLG